MKQRGLFCVIFITSLICFSFSHAQVGRGRIGIGVSAAGNILKGDWKTTDPGYGLSADVSYSLGHNLGILGTLGFDSHGGKTKLEQPTLSNTYQGKLVVTYDILPLKKVDPFLFAGAGLLFYYPRYEDGAALIEGNDFTFNSGIGVDIFLNKSWSVIVMGEAVLTRNDKIDGFDDGSYYDAIASVSVGVRYNLFDKLSR